MAKFEMKAAIAPPRKTQELAGVMEGNIREHVVGGGEILGATPSFSLRTGDSRLNLGVPISEGA
eukprot:CAMPEP_0184680422 /NCGR_PEP_ID=MMETSP0312-20130426/3294_1 /TAXON_ID=31354 /ORGANISM="Compsopogon coeruleus, Strain SAG 36.94" /LENGTH=63 /DNA_ID=CAMNT_0027130513 /DNA_START=1989 /DNA_END=2180 /DNA_ORIENTATION=+